jgi:hypothetical protein
VHAHEEVNGGQGKNHLKTLEERVLAVHTQPGIMLVLISQKEKCSNSLVSSCLQVEIITAEVNPSPNSLTPP